VLQAQRISVSSKFDYPRTTAAAVPWTKPDEIDYDPNAPLPAIGLPNRDFVFVVLADGAVKRASKKCSATSWHAAIRRDDGQLQGVDFGP